MAGALCWVIHSAVNCAVTRGQHPQLPPDSRVPMPSPPRDASAGSSFRSASSERQHGGPAHSPASRLSLPRSPSRKEATARTWDVGPPGSLRVPPRRYTSQHESAHFKHMCFLLRVCCCQAQPPASPELGTDWGIRGTTPSTGPRAGSVFSKCKRAALEMQPPPPPREPPELQSQAAGWSRGIPSSAWTS